MYILAALPFFLFLLPAIHAEAFLNPRAPAVTQAPDPCKLIYSVISACSADVPGFTAQAASDQASCLCFDSTSNIGTAFDGVVTSCASEISAQGDSTDLPVVESLFGFCSINAPTVTTADSSDSSGGEAACSTVLAYLDFCESVSPGFTTLDAVTQAPCLCYSSTVWVPNLFDNAVSSCADFEAAQGDVSLASAASGLEGFCSSIGNVGNPPTVAASATPIDNSPIPVPPSAFPKATVGGSVLTTSGSVTPRPTSGGNSGSATSHKVTSSTSSAAVAVSGNLDFTPLFMGFAALLISSFTMVLWL